MKFLHMHICLLTYVETLSRFCNNAAVTNGADENNDDMTSMVYVNSLGHPRNRTIGITHIRVACD